MKKIVFILVMIVTTNWLSACGSVHSAETDKNGKVCPAGTINKSQCNRVPPKAPGSN